MSETMCFPTEPGPPNSAGEWANLARGIESGGAAGTEKDPTEMSSEELRQQLALTAEKVESERLEKEGLEGTYRPARPGP